jgi:hypothetical protein
MTYSDGLGVFRQPLNQPYGSKSPNYPLRCRIFNDCFGLTFGYKFFTSGCSSCSTSARYFFGARAEENLFWGLQKCQIYLSLTTRFNPWLTKNNSNFYSSQVGAGGLYCLFRYVLTLTYFYRNTVQAVPVHIEVG